MHRLDSSQTRLDPAGEAAYLEPPTGPRKCTPEDLQKVHNEILQITNQRFQLTTLAIGQVSHNLAPLPRTTRAERAHRDDWDGAPARRPPGGGWLSARRIRTLTLSALKVNTSDRDGETLLPGVPRGQYHGRSRSCIALTTRKPGWIQLGRQHISNLPLVPGSALQRICKRCTTRSCR